MVVKQSHYETLLAEYSDSLAVVSLLKRYRLYLEMIPLPIVRLRDGVSYTGTGTSIAPGSAACLPCDIAVLMCDPEWKVKTGVEILIFIHRPQEDFYDLLSRWRQSQVWLDKGYEWVMPHRYRHIYSTEAEDIYPLFVLFSESSERVKRGLKGAGLPFIVQTMETAVEEAALWESDIAEEMGGIDNGSL